MEADSSITAPNTLRILSLNVHFWQTSEFTENDEIIRLFLDEWTPHLVGLQEACF